MYKPKPMTDSELDQFIAELEESEVVQFSNGPLYVPRKQPEPRLGILWAIAGGLMFSGSIFYLIWILYGVYEKIHGGIR